MMITIVFWIFGPDPDPPEEKKAPHSSLLRRIDFWIMAAIWLFGTMNLPGLYSITPLFLVKERMMNIEVANTVFGFSRVGGIAATILIGFVLDRYDIKKILLIVLLTSGLSTIGLALAHKFWILVVMLFIQPTIGMAFFPIGLMAISRITSVNERGIFTGTALSLAAMGGMGLAPLCLGAVADAWSFQVGILLMGIATMVSCVFLKGLKGL
ncbi:MAG TPA: MFS transporter [Desulfatiglandales bacterium]|nr:MFS transporter [Desulfatiglandales bacterium]